MKNLPEELIYGLGFLGVLLLQYLVKRFGPQQPLPPETLAPEVTEQPQDIGASCELPAVPDVQFGQAFVPSATGVAARRRFSRQSLMRDRRGVQDAIVIATILGPCRYHAPHGFD